MHRMLVATDFSSRSDRALRRATMLAKQFPATIVAVNVVDDDQPARLADAAQREATAVLAVPPARSQEIGAGANDSGRHG